MAGKSTARRRQEAEYQEADQNARIDALEQQQAGGYAQPPPAPAYPPPQPAAAPPAAGGGSSIADQLNQLADLHAQGALTDEEFAAAKAGILGH